MDPVIDYDELISNLSGAFQYRYNTVSIKRVRMVGIVFARPNSPLAKSEIIPQIADWHFRSGNHIDFFFAGYTTSRTSSRIHFPFQFRAVRTGCITLRCLTSFDNSSNQKPIGNTVELATSCLQMHDSMNQRSKQQSTLSQQLFVNWIL